MTFVCLLAGLRDSYSTDSHKTGWKGGTRNKRLDFVDNPDLNPDPGIFNVHLCIYLLTLYIMSQDAFVQKERKSIQQHRHI